MKEIKNRLELLELDLKNLEKTLKNEGGPYGTTEDWLHVLHKSRKIEEFAITQMALLKYMEKQDHSD
jgi:hypothetical protein